MHICAYVRMNAVLDDALPQVNNKIYERSIKLTALCVQAFPSHFKVTCVHPSICVCVCV